MPLLIDCNKFCILFQASSHIDILNPGLLSTRGEEPNGIHHAVQARRPETVANQDERQYLENMIQRADRDLVNVLFYS